MKKQKKLPRTHKVSIMLNDKEKKIINNFIVNHKLTTCAKFMRETTIQYILQQTEKEQTLF